MSVVSDFISNIDDLSFQRRILLRGKTFDLIRNGFRSMFDYALTNFKAEIQSPVDTNYLVPGFEGTPQARLVSIRLLQ